MSKAENGGPWGGMMGFALAGLFLWSVVAGVVAEEKAFDLFPMSKPWLDVRIPRYGEDDVLTSMMHAESLTREDAKQLKLEGLTLVMFQSSGEISLRLKTKQALYDVASSTLRTHSTTFIEHAQFEMKGNRMRFDTAKQQGTLEGNVEMLIYGVPLPAQPPAPAVPASLSPDRSPGAAKPSQPEPASSTDPVEVVQSSSSADLLTKPKTAP